MARVLSAKQKFEIWGKGHDREVPDIGGSPLVVVLPRAAESDCCGEPEDEVEGAEAEAQEEGVTRVTSGERPTMEVLLSESVAELGLDADPLDAEDAGEDLADDPDPETEAEE